MNTEIHCLNYTIEIHGQNPARAARIRPNTPILCCNLVAQSGQPTNFAYNTCIAGVAKW